MKIAIYGAQGYALGFYDAYVNIYSEQEIRCFLVSSIQNNPKTLRDLPVVEIEDFFKGMSETEKEDVKIFIATPENVQDEIENTLLQYGFNNFEKIDSEMWTEYMNKYSEKNKSFQPISKFEKGNKSTSIHIFMAKSHKDKPLKNTQSLPNYIYPIQVGTSNCDERIADICDNVGDNISVKNVNYCELTGLYWVWKNILCDNNSTTENDFYGLAQYRRKLILSDDDFLRLVNNDIDVVLPYPLLYEPNINTHHERYIKENDWKALLKAINELQPEYAEEFHAILDQKYLYNYNVILAKKSVLRDYCEWLFPILERTEELSVPKGCERADRYIGYMGESLETLYFQKNSDKLKIVHTGCKLFV